MTHKKRWLDVEILVIDEISMLSAELFDLLSTIGCRIRSNHTAPFGGIQLVLCGDFFQLPPIGLGPKNRLCFHSSTWKKLFKPVQQGGMGGSVIVLDEVFRQKDGDFLKILHEIRRGEVSSATQQLLTQKVVSDLNRKRAQQAALLNQSQSSTHSQADGAAAIVKPTRLFGYNKDVDSTNARELGNNKSASEIFECSDTGDKKYLTQLKNGCRFPEMLELKVGTEVCS
jgi:ATP-dependent DNA helicase PIF1